MQIAPGTTSKTILIYARDTLTGLGKTGLVAASLNIRFTRVETDNDVTITAVTEVDLTALTDAYSSGGWFPVDATNAPGLYRFDIPDAALATGAWEVVVTVVDAGSNNFEVAPTRIELAAYTDANVAQWKGTAVVAPLVAGIPGVSVEYIYGDQNATDSLYTLMGNTVTIDSATTTTITSAATLNQSATDYWKGSWVVMKYDATDSYLARQITAFDPATDTITFRPALPSAPVALDTCYIVPNGRIDVGMVNGTRVTGTGVLGDYWGPL